MTPGDETHAAPHVLETLFESSPDCIKILDRNGRLLLMNAGGAASMQLPHAGSLVGQNWVELWLHGEERDAARLALATAVAGGTAECRGFLPTARGAPRWWHTRLKPILDEAGHLACILAVSRDVSEARLLAADLETAKARTTAIVQATAELVWQADEAQENGSVLAGVTSGAAVNLAGRSVWLSRVHPDDRERVDRVSREGVATGNNYVSEYRFEGPGGGYRWVEDRAVARRSHDGRVTGWVGVITDIEERVHAHAALRDSEEWLRLAVQASHVGIWDVDLVTHHRRWSAELKRMLGLPVDTVEREALLFSLIVPEDRPLVQHAHDVAFRNVGDLVFRIRRADTGEVRWIISSGRPVLDPDGRPVRRVGTFQDITERKLTEQQLWDAANKDPLTGLPNRALFNVKLAEAIATATATRSRLGLIIVDLDHFKEVNDTLGHVAGDVLLRTAAERLTTGCGTQGLVARLGGDEFAILITGAPAGCELARLAARLVESLSRPLSHEAGDIVCSASLGLALFPDHDPDSRELLKNADLALYAAKAAGRACHAVFTPSLKEAVHRRFTVLQRARELLSADDIVPFYQPTVTPGRDRHVAGFEALLRWRDGRTLRSPGEIADAFADPDIASQIGARMLDLAAADLRRWRDDGVPVRSVAVNVAAAEFLRGDVASYWLDTLARYDLPASSLHMEVTESVFLGEGSDTVGDALRRLHQAGVSIALDDFGTGFAALSHLRTYPVDWIKIDRSFTLDLVNDRGARAIVRGMIDLAHDVGIKVIAEGVETQAQLDLLADKGCDLVQGYLLAKPMAASRVAHYLQSAEASPAPMPRASNGRV